MMRAGFARRAERIFSLIYLLLCKIAVFYCLFMAFFFCYVLHLLIRIA